MIRGKLSPLSHRENFIVLVAKKKSIYVSNALFVVKLSVAIVLLQMKMSVLTVTRSNVMGKTIRKVSTFYLNENRVQELRKKSSHCAISSSKIVELLIGDWLGNLTKDEKIQLKTLNLFQKGAK